MITEGNSWVQVGVVSWGIGMLFEIEKNVQVPIRDANFNNAFVFFFFFKLGCGKGNYPGVYTRVNYFKSWITKNIQTK